MPATLAELTTAVTDLITGIVPLASIGLMIAFGFVVTSGALLV